MVCLTFSNFERSLEKIFIYENRPKLTVGVSGGPDSLALAMLLNRWLMKKRGTLIALIIDHKIRKESFSESVQTKKFLISIGIKSKILFVSNKKVKEGKPIQARVNRFEKLLNYCKKNKIFHLFLGHHFDDNIETFILRKIAGSNFEGLNSIQFTTIIENIQVVRPLLFYTKKEILSFNKKLNLPFINDQSNQKIKYSRVAIRKYLNSNQSVRKEVNNELRLIKDNYYFYKKMIYQILNLLTIESRFNKLVLNAKDFFSLNSELRETILAKGIKYINNYNYQIRSIKIQNIIKKISKFQNITIKSSKTLINRIDNQIIITKI